MLYFSPQDTKGASNMRRHRFEEDHLDRLLGKCACSEQNLDTACVMQDALFYVEATDDRYWRKAAIDWLKRHGYEEQARQASARRVA
jgi:hypothetical protein